MKFILFRHKTCKIYSTIFPASHCSRSCGATHRNHCNSPSYQNTLKHTYTAKSAEKILSSSPKIGDFFSKWESFLKIAILRKKFHFEKKSSICGEKEKNSQDFC